MKSLFYGLYCSPPPGALYIQSGSDELITTNQQTHRYNPTKMEELFIVRAAPSQTAAVVLFLSQRVILFYSFSKHRSYYLKMMGEGSWGGFRCCFICPSVGLCTLSKLHWIKALFPPLTIFNFFFFPPLSCCAFLLSIIIFRHCWTWPHILVFESAGPCRPWDPRTPAPTPSLCISKASESAVAKAQGERDCTIQYDTTGLLKAPLMGSRIMAAPYWWCLL